MKRNFMKKAVAVSLSAAMAFSLSAANALTASAASTVSMAKKATVTVGKTKKLTVKTKKLTVKTNKKWKIKSVGGSEAKKYLTIKKASNTKVSLKGKKATKASKPVTVRVRVQKTSGKKTEKVLKCKVTVKKASTPNVTPEPTPTPDVTPTPTPTPEVKTSADVANQAELDAALNDSNIKTINIKTSDKVDFVIPEGTHDVDLTVNAAEASVTNSAKFKSITIEAIAPNTWTEKGKNNTITVKGKSVHFVFDPAAIIDRIIVAIQSAVTIDGKASNTVPVEVAATAEGSSVASQATVAITASAGVSITLEASATGSTVKVVRGQKPFDISLTNKTDNDITVKDDKDVTVVEAKKNTNSPVTGKTQVADTTTPTPTPTPGQSGSSTTKTDLTDGWLDLGSATPTVTATPETITGDSVKTTVKLQFKSATVYKATTVTESGIQTTKKSGDLSGVDIEYRVALENSNGKIAKAGNAVEFTLDAPAEGKIDYYLNIWATVKENGTYKQGREVYVGKFKVTVPAKDNVNEDSQPDNKVVVSTMTNSPSTSIKDDKNKDIHVVKLEKLSDNH